MQNLEHIKLYLRSFAAERDWDKFHSPKNLAMALSVETSELVEHFQWLTEEQSQNLDAKTYEQVSHEVADIQLYLIRLADKLNIDIESAIADKTKINEAKYPASIVRGSAKKYTEY